MPRRLARLLVPALMVLGLGGCADGEVEEANVYVNAVNQTQERFAAESRRLITKLAPDDSARAKQTVLEQIYELVDEFVFELQTIDPPARVKTFHERLVAAGERFGDQLRSAGAALTSGDAARILDGQESLAAASSGMSRSVNEAIAAINAELSG